jgi:hypothetical protein
VSTLNYRARNTGTASAVVRRGCCRALPLVALANIAAGCYLRSDEIPEARRGKPAQIYLEKEQLVIVDL